MASVSVLISLFCFSGCGGGNNSGATGTGGGGSTTTTSTPPTSGDYLLQVGSNAGIFVSTVNTTTGAVSAPVLASGSSPAIQGEIVATPSNSYIYAVSMGSGGISGYRLIGPGLQLQTLASGVSSVVTTTYPANWISIHPGGNFLYVIESSTQSHVEQFKIDATTGALTRIGIIDDSTSADFRSAIIDPTGQFLFVNDLGGGRIFIYQINQSTGALSVLAGSPFLVPSGGLPAQLALDSSGKFLYATLNKGGLAAFAINPTTTVLTNVSGSPFSTSTDGSAPTWMTVNTATNTIYVSSTPDGKIAEFSINETTGVPLQIAGSPVTVPGAAAAGAPGYLVLDPDAGVLFGAADAPTLNILAMATDKNTGTLSILPGVPFTGTPNLTDLYRVKIP